MALNPRSLIFNVVLVLVALILDEAGLDSGGLGIHLRATVSVHVDGVHANLVQISRILVD